MSISSCIPETPSRLRPLSGVSSGPVSYGGLIDCSKSFVAAGFDLIRLHDTNWPHPREVDYYTIFPDFSKDPSDPANYDFVTTDQYIRECAATGADINFRLGVSIEHSEIKRYVYPPADFDKFADICLGIVRHYTEGWAGGEPCPNIKYWEIWNEPDLVSGFGRDYLPSPTWIGTFEQFMELYAAVALRLKNHNPALKVGGPGFAYVLDNPFCMQFLETAAERNLPMDFCSWHCYGARPLRVIEMAAKVRETLDRIGYSGAENHATEWAYIPKGNSCGKMFQTGNEAFCTASHAQMQGIEGAAFAGAFWIAAQSAPLDRAAFFCACPTNSLSLFNLYGKPERVYYAFLHTARFAQLPVITEITLPEDGEGLFKLCCESEDGKRAGVLLANYFGEPGTYCLAHAQAKNLSAFRTDGDCDYSEFLMHDGSIRLEENSVISVLWDRE